jgi:ABC-type Fe3+-siderophore transport system permease subunit
MSCDNSFPAEHEIAYVSSWAGAGAVCTYLIWLIAILRDPALDSDPGPWMQVGAGCTGVIALVWVLTAAVLH